MKYTYYFILTFLFFFSGCSPKKILIKQDFIVSNYFERKISKLQNSKKPNIKNNQDLMIAHIEYGFGVIMEKSDRLIEKDYSKAMDHYKKAYSHFNSARFLGNGNLYIKYPNFKDWLKNETTIKFQKNDVKELYWLAAAYAGAVSSSRGDPFELIQLPIIKKILNMAVSLESEWGNGALHSALMSYTAIRTDLDDSLRIDSVNFYFNNALNYSDSLDASIFVSYAEIVHKPFQEKKGFKDKLNYALNIKSDKKKRFELSNLIAKNRAKWLLSNIEEYFIE